MRRRIVNILCGLSALLFVATVGMWVRSHYIADTLWTERAIFTDDWYVFRRSAVIRYGGLRLLWEDGLDMSGRDPETIRRYQQAQGRRRWYFEHERTDDYEIEPTVSFAEHRYPYLFLRQPYSIWEKMGFDWRGACYRLRGSSVVEVSVGLTVPLWFLSLWFAISPAMWMRKRILRYARMRRHCCPVCGYDLRATPERCPECGMSVRGGDGK